MWIKRHPGATMPGVANIDDVANNHVANIRRVANIPEPANKGLPIWYMAHVVVPHMRK